MILGNTSFLVFSFFFPNISRPMRGQIINESIDSAYFVLSETDTQTCIIQNVTAHL